MHFHELDRGELMAVGGGLVLALSLLLSWFTLGNAHAVLNGCRGPNATCSGWRSLSVVRWLLLLTAVAPLILTWIILRGHGLSWPRGELTAITALCALTLILFRGVIDKPGAPRGQISVAVGWWTALFGGLLILVGSVWRSQESAGRRKPPGVL
ncbi:MAG: hypothetical protein JO168_27385 [Solirubrobacterales bacterium]|nr:hypothetical protein [Solirubrobacterales bacterium]MBV9716728.1 hypothetical protein [Solirubrobacterales bacterium]